MLQSHAWFNVSSLPYSVPVLSLPSGQSLVSDPSSPAVGAQPAPRGGASPGPRGGARQGWGRGLAGLKDEVRLRLRGGLPVGLRSGY